MMLREEDADPADGDGRRRWRASASPEARCRRDVDASAGTRKVITPRRIVKIVAESPCRNFRSQVVARRGDDPSIDVNRVFAPHPFEALLLDEVQELALKGKSQI